ncbi:MAG: hypothetical protein EHM93_09955 [Bacteroidales bacterium]|nr:MAG: hypothetical protein EHM93_09955 [Bacteroidales bacterium]
MALKVKSEKVKPKGKFLVFIFFFAMLLILFAIFLAILLVIGGFSLSNDYFTFYIDFLTLTIILPFIIALTTILSFKYSRMHVTPGHSVNIPRLKELFLTKTGYRVIEEREGYIKFESSKAFSRFIWLNIDKPIIEVNGDEVQITLKKHTEAVITPLLVYGKHFDMNAES